jgi:Ser/Thr protein kinase RdoA (MazF antagonist)
MTKRDAAHERADAQAMLIAQRFLPQESDFRISPLGKGLINDTRLLECGSGPFVLQRINGLVFKDPEAIDANLLRVQDWLAQHPHAAIRMPRLLRDAEGRATLHDDEGGAWRLMEYIGQSRVLKPLQNPRQAHEIGLTLGRFHAALADLDPSELTLSLPELHDSPRYKANLDAAVKAPQRPICDEVAAALQAIEARAALLPVLQRAQSEGALPTTVTHGDPKLDNVLFALESDRALCLIDLDTVQPGLLHHDVGDCVRSCCNRANGLEDPYPKAELDLDLARALMTGYADAAASLFDDKMAALLYPAIALIPLELAIRFLTDYLQGDRYFRVAHPRQNLTKARSQLALVADIEAKRDAIETLIADCFPSAPTTSPRRARRGRVQPQVLEQRPLQERTQAVLEQLADLLAELQHPRAYEVRDLARCFAEEPERVWRALDGNHWWAGAGSLAAETMADNPGLDPQHWQQQVRRFRDLLCELAELLQARGPANPGIGSWLLAFRNWNATGV